MKWQSVAAKFFFQPYLEKLTNYDQEYCDFLKKLGWSDECSNPEKILSFYNIFEVSNYPGMYSGAPFLGGLRGLKPPHN